MAQKLYCYIDETGQHTKGRLFIVASVVLDLKRDDVYSDLLSIEKQSGKGTLKWSKAQESVKRAYINAVLAHSDLHARMGYAAYPGPTDYTVQTARTAVLAILQQGEPPFKATLIVDGLQKAQTDLFRQHLVAAGIFHEGIKGARDESNAIIRLADALCGFAWAGLHDHTVFASMLKDAQKRNCIREF